MPGIKEKTTLTLDAQTKAEAKEILDELGMSLSTYIDISLGQLVRDQGMPFTPTIRRKAERQLTPEEFIVEARRLLSGSDTDTQAGLAALTAEDERRMLEDRDA
ncbi:type II toxin-antitoxin system RelB/DinJ family antitoxin [Bifidobacterium saguinibicoloris]|uniref:type II toxin-antitoxin system RelB/DinJ family antitoxin n=1 Tax=Bifidobacterium saguinibicoloris TaxID=2834433 RepID=UPI001C59B68A|nr:type II toxin-antitoxin system RelB/DinJ family antitoxin [Bifidobacterium saguinibicoloris]MBW3080152.1 type II toxin-antitoxin system RelB/DinJ family antitoxin [Bifidobacterium saguinibicoloris]